MMPNMIRCLTIVLQQNPTIRPLVEQDSKTLQQLLPEIPFWVKNPDYDRVSLCHFLQSLVYIVT